MWKTISSTIGGNYLLKYDISNDLFIFHLTNLKIIWMKEFAKDFVLTKFEESNPTLDFEDSVKEIKSLLDLENTHITIDEKETTVTLNITNVKNLTDVDVDIVFEIELDQVEQEKFTEAVTIPMVKTICILEKQRETLVNLLKKKDLELNQYRFEKDAISRTDLITKNFDESILRISSKDLMVSVFNKDEKFMKSLGEMDEKVVNVSVEPWNQIKKRRKNFNSGTAARKKRNEIIFK